ncbi:MAG: D-alanine--D-alanine ligase A, partial [Eubacteriales bacterium]
MKPAVCVVFGGKSSEHEISCMSAYNIISHLNREKYSLLLVGITKEGESFLYSGDISHIKDGSWADA